jgi:anti-sigma factor RsiW
MNEVDPAEHRRDFEFVGHRERRAGWAAVSVGAAFLIAGVTALAFGVIWAAGVVGSGAVMLFLGVARLRNARATRAVGRKSEKPEVGSSDE